MPRDQINELTAFLAVARERSFTRAAAGMGVTPSALSHTIKGLEERLGLRLLSRTTRNVAPTEAGERLQRQIAPLFDQIAAEIDEIGAFRDKPVGALRITCTDVVIETVFRPRLGAFLQRYPDIKVELDMSYELVDIVAERFDAGVRIGEALEKDMIATRIGPDWRFSVVGSPSTRYPKHPMSFVGKTASISASLDPEAFCPGNSALRRAVISVCVLWAKQLSIRPAMH